MPTRPIFDAYNRIAFQPALLISSNRGARPDLARISRLPGMRLIVARDHSAAKEKAMTGAWLWPGSVADLIIRLSQATFSTDKEAYGLLFRIFRACFLDESIRQGKVNPNKLHIAGDGTPVVTAARFRSHHTCDCWKNGNFNCDCNRYFPQPDCSVGWDSSRECWYFGYDLYLLTDADSELPLFPLYHAASNVR